MKRREFIKGSAIISAAVAVPTIADATSGLLATNKERKVRTMLNAKKALVGTLPVLRVFAGDNNDYVSPYVFFDEFGPVNLNASAAPLRVDAHPHAGVIPTTYFLEGSGHHRDSLNYDFQIGKGDFMLFTSGKGAIHMEETGENLYQQGGIYHGFQIWLNMPAKYKFVDPSTQLFDSKKMGSIVDENYSATVVMGELLGTKSQIETMFPVFYFHLKMKAGCKLSIPTEPTHNAFVYVINGKVETAERKEISANQIGLYERGESTINLFAENDAELLLLGGKPHNEEVYAYGPFVMNTEQEITRCINDYNSGKMGNPQLVNAK
jgi:redox-sensitive bicupin YhaK (pirin superfamily)